MDTIEYLVTTKHLTPDFRPPEPEKPIKVVKSGVIFQQQCRNGLRYDIAVSWLQKAIRRGLIDQALYCAYHIASLGKMFKSHLCNRLIMILSEDIGPAGNPGLSVTIHDLYCQAMSNDEPGSEIIQMISLLADSSKSRITDLLIHRYEGTPEISLSLGMKHAIAWACLQCATREKRDVIVCGSVKKLKVYELWNALLTRTDGNDDIVALMHLFEIRGPTYGIMHLIHAIILAYDGPTAPSDDVPPARGPTELPKWDDLSKLDFPIMDDAVDVHTYYGREILGRGLAHFYDRGSKLNPDQWKPHPLEIESINDLRSKIKEPLVESSSPREYQGKLVSDTIKHLRDNRTGWLLMACGTGKTKTGHWVMQGLLDKGTSALVVVVTPFLHILRQFHASWAAMNRMHKIRSITGIVASCRDKYDKDDYSNYVYLAPSEVDKFVTSHTGIKFIFTTYSSLPKILHLKPMLTIYDEAHHAKSYKVFDSGMELFLTATPNKHYHAFGEIIARYNLREAVDNGYLTPYKIFVVRDPCRMSALEHIQTLAKKTIVYCSTNSEAKELHQLYSSSGTRSFYIDCKSNQSDRDYIFSNYRKLDRAVIFNCAILGEGVDFTDCDSILISSGYVSSARVVQAMGRPLRLHEGKQCAYIFMMDDKNTSARIRAMEQYDPKVLSYLSWI